MMIRVMVLATAVTVAHGTVWAQLSEAPVGTKGGTEGGTEVGTKIASNFNTPLEAPPPAMLEQSSQLLTEPASKVATQSLPCSQMRMVPASFVVAPAGLPDAPSAYDPLSRHCKFELVLHQTYSPYTFASAGFDATWAQMWAQWPQYGGGMQGWGKRLGATLADEESRRFIQNFVLASLLHEDPRYFPSGRNGFVSRAWYAATRVLITRDDYGRDVFNQAEFLGASFTSSLQDAYYPRPDRTLGATMNRFLGSLSSDATTNVLHEFTPDLKRLFHKHCPQSIQRFEARMPIPEDVKP